MTPYKEKYAVGTKVRIRSAETLKAFKRDWKYHHPLSDQQMQSAGQLDTVGFYHGGDVLYELENTPGTEGVPPCMSRPAQSRSEAHATA